MISAIRRLVVLLPLVTTSACAFADRKELVDR